MLFVLFSGISAAAYGQVSAPADSLKADSLRIARKNIKPADNLNKQYDIGDLYGDLFHPHKVPDSLHKKSGITIIPNIASNPTIGSQIGIKAVAGIKLGSDPNTLLSVASTSASITTKGIIYFYINHNVFTPGNKWNFQGSLVAAKTVSPDFGLGIGRGNYDSEENHVLSDPERKGHALHSYYFNLREKAYKQVVKNLFLGAGLSFDVRRSITEKGDTAGKLTPSKVYNSRYGFPQDHYSANGFLFNAEYTTRDNQNRAYKGIYADAGFRINQTWIGSTKSSVQFTTDFRKYFSLSERNPEHVIAIWNWGSYLISGAVPYLELPGSGRDVNFRSGRGYTVTYFKGTQYNYSEIEYRFPILRNKFISGVTFFNMQTANDEMGTKLFQVWQPGGGGGLRVLFNKATRTNLCLDYAFGKYGSKGFFLGLNEAF
ncbi:BamA/TamA family outer membrane protein [Mucilaginibacter xinganensis]|uniref:BamA/TamA family outer membrane protein n=1 Tax=Mucilaginibacter xinganensis TaxID=1234841 RepID=UPI0012FD9B4D|nr:BamA/TamA family outer membrane protein [Mucilaginibacter xinganensis]